MTILRIPMISHHFSTKVLRTGPMSTEHATLFAWVLHTERLQTRCQ